MHALLRPACACAKIQVSHGRTLLDHEHMIRACRGWRGGWWACSCTPGRSACRGWWGWVVGMLMYLQPEVAVVGGGHAHVHATGGGGICRKMVEKLVRTAKRTQRSIPGARGRFLPNLGQKLSFLPYIWQKLPSGSRDRSSTKRPKNLSKLPKNAAIYPGSLRAIFARFRAKTAFFALKLAKIAHQAPWIDRKNPYRIPIARGPSGLPG